MSLSSPVELHRIDERFKAIAFGALHGATELTSPDGERIPIDQTVLDPTPETFPFCFAFQGDGDDRWHLPGWGHLLSLVRRVGADQHHASLVVESTVSDTYAEFTGSAEHDAVVVRIGQAAQDGDGFLEWDVLATSPDGGAFRLPVGAVGDDVQAAVQGGDVDFVSVPRAAVLHALDAAVGAHLYLIAAPLAEDTLDTMGLL
ncbi:hypothetical protein [Xylanimonas ulmi]|uniref:Uncharacterized protein n=1 Tax=Xylanimonas ulmi TaxID=228973 RepID=A0A4Q7M5E1_9MICO|nr:hypothetical protein [Xylanibacterium ulmi]RZS62253.1 hypothetical protein EV386_2578 [Xylanibacterium ulmi]